jgi:hypothetical protein
VRYDPSRSEVAEIETFWTLWGTTLLFGILAAVFLSVGLGLLSGLILP